MPQFVLEIGTEEIPARFLPQLERDLTDAFGRHLDGSDIPYGKIKAFSTPRRLVVSIDGLDSHQLSGEEIVTGPPAAVAFDGEGQPTKAAIGFAKTHGVELDDLYRKETPKGEYLAVTRQKGGHPTIDLLPDICRKVIGGLPFPKKMRWESEGATFARPVRWLLALLDEKVVAFSAASLTAGRTTHGHRILGPGPFEIPSAAAYFDILSDQGAVVLDSGERQQLIKDQGSSLAREKNGEVVWSDALLQEVTGLVEKPQAMLGRFDDKYLDLPREVLLTSMESHQKSFGVEDPSGRLLPYFLCTLNIDSTNPALVKKGWERVLKARLEDARFFWEVDGKVALDDWVKALDDVVFLGPLGSMGAKSRRLEQLCRYLSGELAPGKEKQLGRAGRLAKADLVSEMVGEFADLQGIMGSIYARKQNEPDEVSLAIYEHYLPLGQDSPVPQRVEGAILALADKADTLVGCFGLGKIPTGANDPYALRRQCLGIIRIVVHHAFRIDLDLLLRQALGGYGEVQWKLLPEETVERLKEFFTQRLRAFYTSKDYPTRVVDAVLGAGINDLWAVNERLIALDHFSKEPDFERAVLTFKRADNIIRKQAGDEDLTGEFEIGRLVEPQEKELARRLEELAPRWETLWGADDFDALFSLLRELRPAVDDFFDHVMVMCDEPKLRRNRLNLLKALVDRLSQLADFGALQI